jgi:hypothetical protein
MPIIFFSSFCRSLTAKKPAVAGGGVGRWGQGGGTVCCSAESFVAKAKKKHSFNRRASSRVLGFARSVVYTRRKLTAC